MWPYADRIQFAPDRTASRYAVCSFRHSRPIHPIYSQAKRKRRRTGQIRPFHMAPLFRPESDSALGGVESQTLSLAMSCLAPLPR